METNNKNLWENATWKGNRIAQLKNSLKLTPRQRFEALEDFADTCQWLANSNKSYHDNKKPIKKDS